MTEPNRIRKNEIGQLIQLNEEQKEAIRLIINNQIIIITGATGSGKSLVCAHYAVDILNKKEANRIYIARPTVEVGKSLGYIPGDLNAKLDPYFEAFLDNVYDTMKDKTKYAKWVNEEERFKFSAIQHIRGKTFNDLLVIEEGQNTSKKEMEAIVTRLGINGKIIINGDLAQKDGPENDGLSWLFNKIIAKVPEIKRIHLKENHRSDLVQKILKAEYGE
jgi:phosphate starvation-inducible PhoH-like protein